MISGLQTIIIIYMGISRFCFYRDGRRRLECISAEKSPHTLSEIGEEMNLYRGPGSKPSMTYVPGCDNDACNAMITRACERHVAVSLDGPRLTLAIRRDDGDDDDNDVTIEIVPLSRRCRPHRLALVHPRLY